VLRARLDLSNSSEMSADRLGGVGDATPKRAVVPGPVAVGELAPSEVRNSTVALSSSFSLSKFSTFPLRNEISLLNSSNWEIKTAILSSNNSDMQLRNSVRRSEPALEAAPEDMVVAGKRGAECTGCEPLSRETGFGFFGLIEAAGGERVSVGLFVLPLPFTGVG